MENNDLSTLRTVNPTWMISLLVTWSVFWRGMLIGSIAFWIVAIIAGLITYAFKGNAGAWGALMGLIPFLGSFVLATKMVLKKKRFNGFNILIVESQDDA